MIGIPIGPDPKGQGLTSAPIDKDRGLYRCRSKRIGIYIGSQPKENDFI